MTSPIQLDTPKISDAANPTQPAKRNDEAEMRRAAQEFEALLLGQMTAALRPNGDDEEEGLFGSGGGLGLSQQMFGEQLAQQMAQQGGIGLADLMLQNFRTAHGAKSSPAGRETQRALAVARFLRETARVRESDASGQPSAASRQPNETKSVRHIHAKSGAFSSDASPTIKAADIKTPQDIAPSQDFTLRAAFSSSTARLSSNAHARFRKTHHAPPQPVAAPALNTEEPVLLSEATPAEVAAYDARVSGKSVQNFDAAANKKLTNAVANAPSTTSAKASRVALHSPVVGQLRSNFGARRDPFNGKRKFHQGVDIAAPRGTPIAAAADGKVTFAGRNKGYGNSVVIEHADGRRTRYAHAERLYVQAGETVHSGQIIAAVGSTGHSTGPHLHFEVIENNRRINPLHVLANVSAPFRR